MVLYNKLAGDIPTIQRVTVYSSTVIEVVWELPYPRRTITGFFVSVSNNVNSETRTIPVDVITALNITNLLPSTMYTITVAARFLGNMEGNRSQPVMATTMDDVTTSKSIYEIVNLWLLCAFLQPLVEVVSHQGMSQS